MRKLNREGMTFYEWLRACNYVRKLKINLIIAYKAWDAGEDPAEHKDH